MVEQAVAGLATINSWTANSHTLTTANGTTSESRCAMLVIDDDGAGNPSAAATVICPTATKAYIVRNLSGQTVTVKTAAGTGVAVPNNQAALVFCDGTNVVTGAFDGDVIGPASATDNAIARFDLTTGKLIQNSGVTIDDSNNVTGVANLAYTGTLTGGTGIINIGSGQVYKAADGKVGIGTSSPTGKLHIGGTAAGSVQAVLTNGASDPNFQLHVVNGASGPTSGIIQAYLALAYEGVGYGPQISFRRGNTTTDGYLTFDMQGFERMQLTTSGNVGIGVTPQARLNVQYADSAPTASGTISSGVVFQYAAGGVALNMGSSSDGYVYFNSAFANNAAVGQAYRFYQGATQAMTLDASGNLLVGRTSKINNGRVEALAASSEQAFVAQVQTDGNSLFQGFNAAGNAVFQATGSGNLTANGTIEFPGVYATTTGSAANVFVASNGHLQRSTSSLKYKTDVENATHGLAEVMQLRPVTYKSKTDGDKVFSGLIAEEVHEAGLTEFVQYAQDGTPDALAYGNMVSICIKAIQEQQALITQLQADVAALKGN